MKDARYGYVGRHRKKQGLWGSIGFKWILSAVVSGLVAALAKALFADLIDFKEVLKHITEGLQEGR